MLGWINLIPPPKAWPDPAWLDVEHPGYSKRMAEREAEVMALTSSQRRWDEWMFLAQARLMPTFTPRQYDVAPAPKAVHDKLLKRFGRRRALAGHARTCLSADVAGLLPSEACGPSCPSFLVRPAFACRARATHSNGRATGC